MRGQCWIKWVWPDNRLQRTVTSPPAAEPERSTCRFRVPSLDVQAVPGDEPVEAVRRPNSRPETKKGIVDSKTFSTGVLNLIYRTEGK